MHVTRKRSDARQGRLAEKARAGNVSLGSDLFVIGGGVVGLCSAYFAAKEGMRVTVLDQGQPGHGAALVSAGLIVPSHVVPLAAPKVIRQGLRWLLNPESPFHIRPRLSWGLLKWLWRFRKYCTDENVERAAPVFRELQMASLALFDRLSRTDGFDFGFRQQGLLDAYVDRAAFKATCRSLEAHRNVETSFRVLDDHQIREVEPCLSDRVVGGVLHTEDAHVDPAKFLSELVRNLQEMGVVILSETRVDGWDVEGASVAAVRTNRGRLQAGQYVVAGGSWSPQLVRDLRIKLPIEAGKGYSVTVPRTGDMPSIPMRLAEAKVATLPLPDSFRLAGTLELDGLNERVNRRRVDGIVRSAREYFSVKGDWEHAKSCVGLRPCTPDGVPIIGKQKRYDNLIIATGHATVGLSLGPITGQLVAQLATKTTPSVDMEALGADRF